MNTEAEEQDVEYTIKYHVKRTIDEKWWKVVLLLLVCILRAPSGFSEHHEPSCTCSFDLLGSSTHGICKTPWWWLQLGPPVPRRTCKNGTSNAWSKCSEDILRWPSRPHQMRGNLHQCRRPAPIETKPLSRQPWKPCSSTYAGWFL